MMEAKARLTRSAQFFFNNWEYLRDIDPGCCLTRPLANPQLYIDYLDPFNCECRVYGRLKDEGREDLAVKAYGYLLLTAEQETALAKIILGPDSGYNPHEACNAPDSHNVWGRWEQHRALPIRAIVKQLVDDDPFQTTQLGKLWLDLEQFHRLGIIVRDVHEGNYLGGGKLVDFSRALTMYHPCLDQVRPLILRGFRCDDPEGLENMLIAWSQCNPSEPIDALESLQRFVGGYGPNGNYGHDPREYDWRKTEESVEIADAYVAGELFADQDSASEFGDTVLS